MARAVAAQHALDGANPPRPRAAVDRPHRDLVVSPSEADRVRLQVETANISRRDAGQNALGIMTFTHTEPTSDPLTVWAQGVVRVYGPDDATTFDLSGVRTNAERRVDSFRTLAAACAVTRTEGGYVSRADGGESSTPAKVSAYVKDDPGGAIRSRYSVTEEDERKAREVRAWVRLHPPQNDWGRTVQATLAEDYVPPRDAGTIASAIAGYERHQQEVADHSQAQGAQQSRSGSRWLNKVGDQIVVPGQVVHVQRLHYPGRPMPHVLYLVRSADGDLIKWIASQPKGMREGDAVTVAGRVKGHSEFNGEKQTDMHHCQVRIHAAS